MYFKKWFVNLSKVHIGRYYFHPCFMDCELWHKEAKYQVQCHILANHRTKILNTCNQTPQFMHLTTYLALFIIYYLLMSLWKQLTNFGFYI